MRRILTLLLLLLLGNPSALAQEFVVSIDGEPFTRRFVGNPPRGDKLVEFVRESESFERWTKLVGFRYQQMPHLENDPVKVALALAQKVKASNPKAQSSAIANKDNTEAIVDFVTWPPDGTFMEFNVFRYVRSEDGNAVVSLQLAHRFTDASAAGIEKFKSFRQSWLKQAAAFEMRHVHRTLAR